MSYEFWRWFYQVHLYMFMWHFNCLKSVRSLANNRSFFFWHTCETGLKLWWRTAHIYHRNICKQLCFGWSKYDAWLTYVFPFLFFQFQLNSKPPSASHPFYNRSRWCHTCVSFEYFRELRNKLVQAAITHLIHYKKTSGRQILSLFKPDSKTKKGWSRAGSNRRPSVC